MKSIGIISGSGDLPHTLAKSLGLKGYTVIRIALLGQACADQINTLDGPILWAGLGEVGKMLQFLKSYNAFDLILVGGVKRPSFRSLQVDSLGVQWLKLLGKRLLLGDNALLTGLMHLLTESGFTVHKPADFLDLTLSESILQNPISSDDLSDIQRGVSILRTLSPFDIGQAIIVEDGLILGIEAIEGTAELIKRCTPFKRVPGRGILIKLTKEGQCNIDLPTIGMETISLLKIGQFRGIAIDSTTQIIDKQACLNTLDPLFLHHVE